MERYLVSYSIKQLDDKNHGLLVDRSATFSNFHDAIAFIKKINNTKEILGRPVMELI